MIHVQELTKTYRVPKRASGVVFGQRSRLWWDVPVQDSFDLLRDIYRVPENDYRQSLGQRIHCELAASFVCALRDAPVVSKIQKAG